MSSFSHTKSLYNMIYDCVFQVITAPLVKALQHHLPAAKDTTAQKAVMQKSTVHQEHIRIRLHRDLVKSVLLVWEMVYVT